MCGLCRCSGGPDDESTHQHDHHFWRFGIFGMTTPPVLPSQAERPLVGVPCLFTLVYVTIPQVGLALTICVMEVLESSVSALFVCFAQVWCAPILFPLSACRLQFFRWGIRIPHTEGGSCVRCDGRNRRTQRLCSPHILTCTRS